MSVMRRLLLLLLAVSTLGGCARALFPTNEPRTQFEKYDRRRNNFAPPQQADVFGNPRPALRARLSPDRS
jgi:hypothetical protein